MREHALPMLCGSRSRRSAGDGHVAVLAESAPALRPSDEHEPAGELDPRPLPSRPSALMANMARSRS